MSPAALIQLFQAISVLFSGFLVFKLYSSGLYRRYRIFFVYIVFRVLYQTCFWFEYRVGPTSQTYLDLFLYTEPLVLLFYILVVLELYGLVLQRYKGIYTLGRWAMYAAITISVTISLLVMLPKIAPSTPEPSKYLFREIGVERGVDLSLVLFILLIILFLGMYRVPLSRNIVVHTGIYAVFFLSQTFVLLARTLWGIKTTDGINLCLTVISAACTAAWGLLLSAQGEETPVNAPQIYSERRVLQQLDSLNATLMKVSRK